MSDTLVPLAYDRYNPETYPSNPRQREAVKNIKVVPQKIKKNSDVSKTLFQDIIKKIGKKTIPAPKTPIKLKGGGSTTKETIKVVELPDSSSIVIPDSKKFDYKYIYNATKAQKCFDGIKINGNRYSDVIFYSKKKLVI